MGELFGRRHDEKTDEPAVRLIRPRRRAADPTTPVDGDAADTPSVDVSVVDAPAVDRSAVEAPFADAPVVEEAPPTPRPAPMPAEEPETVAPRTLERGKIPQTDTAFAPPAPTVVPPEAPERPLEPVARAGPESPPRPAPLPGAATTAPRTTTGGHAHKRGHHHRSAGSSERELRPATEGRPTAAPPTSRRKRLAVGLVALAVIVFLGRDVVQHRLHPGPGPSAAGSKHSPVPSTTVAPAPVIVNGSQIMPSGPIITLNPALAQPGSKMDVNGAGFDAGSMVDLSLRVSGVQHDLVLGSVTVDKSGNINMNVPVPENVTGSSVLVIAKQRNSDHTATAEAAAVSGIGTVTLGKGSGKPGDTISISARGFSPNEPINVYWGRVSGTPAATLQADGGGGVGQAPVRVGTGVVGQTTVVLVGAKSGTAATASFYMNGLYPSAVVTPYAVKAKQSVTLSGKGFAPTEPVDVYINSSAGLPVFKTTSDGQGNVHGATLQIPYGLRNKQSVVMVGELSRASVSSGFTILPYTPSAQPSTYGGAVGTSFSFFATGFGPDEVVLVHLGGGQGQTGQLVSAFRVDDKGNAGAAGSFQVAPGDQGILHFSLTGRQSQSTAGVAFSVSAAVGPVSNVPPRQPYVLPPDLAQDQPSAQPGAPGPSSSSPSTQPGAPSPSTSTPSTEPGTSSPPTSVSSVAWRSEPNGTHSGPAQVEGHLSGERVMRTVAHRSWWQAIVHFFRLRLVRQVTRHRTARTASHRAWWRSIVHFFRL
jgi:hypothetical protein